MISAPKIDFHPLTDAQFGDYRAYFIADYGQEIALNYRVPLGQALPQSEAVNGIRALRQIVSGRSTGDHSAGITGG